MGIFGKFSKKKEHDKDLQRPVKEVVKCANCQNTFSWDDTYLYEIGAPYLGARLYCPYCGFRIADAFDSQHWQWYGPNAKANKGKVMLPKPDFLFVGIAAVRIKRVPHHAEPSWNDTFLNLAKLSTKPKIWEPAVSVNHARAETINRDLLIEPTKAIIEVIMVFKEITQEVKGKIKETLRTIPVLPKELLQAAFQHYKVSWRISPDNVPFEGNLDTVCDHLFSHLEKHALKPGYESVHLTLKKYQIRESDAEDIVSGASKVIEAFDNRFMRLMGIDVLYEEIARPHLIGRADLDYYCILE